MVRETRPWPILSWVSAFSQYLITTLIRIFACYFVRNVLSHTRILAHISTIISTFPFIIFLLHITIFPPQILHAYPWTSTMICKNIGANMSPTLSAHNPCHNVIHAHVPRVLYCQYRQRWARGSLSWGWACPGLHLYMFLQSECLVGHIRPDKEMTARLKGIIV